MTSEYVSGDVQDSGLEAADLSDKEDILNDEILGPVQEEPPPSPKEGRNLNQEVLEAAEKNEVLKLQDLLSQDPSLVHIRDEDSYTPLHRACYNNNVEVIKILLSYGADPCARTQDQWTPLHCACKWDSVEAVSLLLQNGADISAVSQGGLTPLHLSASGRNKRCLELLLWHPFVDGRMESAGGETAYKLAHKDGPHLALFEMLEEAINTY